MYGAPFWLERGQNGPVVSLCGGGRGACRSAYLVVSKPVICVGMMHTTNAKIEDVLFWPLAAQLTLLSPTIALALVHSVRRGPVGAEGAWVSASASLAGMEGTVVGHGCLLAFFFFTTTNVTHTCKEMTLRSPFGHAEQANSNKYTDE